MIRLLALWFGLLVCVHAGAGAWAQPAVNQNQPVYMQADQLGYDQKNAIVVARGNVEVAQGNTRLLADRITYYQNYQVVRADGNVQVFDRTTGEVYYAERVQLKDDLREGIIRQFRVRMADNSQFAASEATKVSDTRTELSNAVYSPCKICEGKSPLWQMKADKVAVDEAEQEVSYEDLYLEIYGVPVAYAPFFFHPTPDADRKSGFLQPEYSQKSNLGTVVKTPYYINIAPNQDATITPIYTTKEGPVFDGEYRILTDAGGYEFKGSVTYPDKRDDNGIELSEREVRGHLFAKGNHQFNSHWGAGFDVQRATDDTYLRKYDYGNYNSLNSRVFVEGNYGRSYAVVQGLAFQGLRVDDDPATEPLVLPLAAAHIESNPGWNGSRLYASANTQVVDRDEGAMASRLSATQGIKVPLVTSGGQLLDADAHLRTDHYMVDDIPRPGGTTTDADATRFIPQASLKWRYPLMKLVGDASLTIEPTVMAVARSNGNNPDIIPNEDNRILEFSDGHLFDPTPLPGYDTVENGSRVAYGMQGEWLFGGGQNLNFLFGQSYGTQTDSPFFYSNTATEHFSDYVGRVGMDYAPFMLAYHFRLDQDDLNPNANTFSTGLDFDSFNWQLHYVTLDDDVFLQDREELLTSMAIALSDEWSMNGSARRDILNEDMLFAGAGLQYQNECFTLLTSFKRQFTRDRDVEPDTSITVRVSFKNLN